MTPHILDGRAQLCIAGPLAVRPNPVPEGLSLKGLGCFGRSVGCTGRIETTFSFQGSNLGTLTSPFHHSDVAVFCVSMAIMDTMSN